MFTLLILHHEDALIRHMHMHMIEVGHLKKLGGRSVLLVSFVSWSLTNAFVPIDPKNVKTIYGFGSVAYCCVWQSRGGARISFQEGP
ncbi:hypothetical protein M0R45_009978 [Rubus argutus]|uniref:Uncharacterized protein n=1 Tax=Rubus argutus TaxID=59490 RepID=A0AAW1Y5L0_RUBAR